MDVTVSHRAPEDLIIHSDTESALQATSVTAQVKHTASWGGMTGNKRARQCARNAQTFSAAM